MGLCLEVEFLFKNYDVLTKSKRKELFNNIQRIENDFLKFLEQNPIENSEDYELDYLKSIARYLELNKNLFYKESSSIYGILNIDKNIKYTGDCNQIVNLYIHLFSLENDVRSLRIKQLKDHVCLNYKDIDIETTNSSFTKYDDYLYVSEVWEMIAINILDVNDYDLISSEVSANDFLMACKICKKLSSHNKTTEHNLIVAYQKMGRHLEKIKQYKSALKFWKLVGFEKGYHEFLIRYVKHLVEQKKFSYALKMSKKSKNNDLILFAYNHFVNNLTISKKFEKALKFAKKSKDQDLIKFVASNYYNFLYPQTKTDSDSKRRNILKKMYKLAIILDDQKLARSIKNMI